MTPIIEGTQTAPDRYHVTVRPEHGNPVTLHVVPAGAAGYAVRRDPDSSGHITAHRSFEAAVKSSNYRVRRYLSSCQRTARKRARA